MSIASSLEALAQAKTDIANAITQQGGTVGADDGMTSFAADILTIPTGFKVETGIVTIETTAGSLEYTTNGITQIEGAVLVRYGNNTTGNGALSHIITNDDEVNRFFYKTASQVSYNSGGSINQETHTVTFGNTSQYATNTFMSGMIFKVVVWGT